ncbi:hypothetical protein [Streptomyces sp. NPDC019937]|uniref:hypothetical protein n=1 Tax=Streptomyces sp. NPDC019937 TaxID=3154787 RepID=UPI003401B69D
MDEARLWALMEEPGEREPLVTRGEARAAVALMQLLGEHGGELAAAADELAARIGRRLSAE